MAQALQPVVARFALPQAHLQTIIDGMAMDLDQVRYLDFADLERYCHKVAGVVGLLSAEIFGRTDERTLDYARDLGIAFQLTNIIRDVGEDARRGRIYLPQDELARFGVAPATLLRAQGGEAFRALMAFQIERARAWYDRALAALPEADRRAQRTGLIMAAIYRTLLDEIAGDSEAVLRGRVSLTPLRKLWIAWKTVAARVSGPARDVAVVGAGWAGCAAAVTLARAGRRVTIYEAAGTPGGRARRVARDGLALDNGQHLLVGAYRATLELIATLHGAAAPRVLLRQPLTLAPLARDGVRLAAWPLPAPLHLAGALAGASGLSWRERLALIRDYRALAARGFRCAADATVATLFAATPPRAFAALWEPLTLAALNTPPERASAQMFANVLAAAFAGARSDSDFLVPAVDLSALLPDAAVADVVARGGRRSHRDDDRADRARRRRRRDPCAPRRAGAPRRVVLATGPHQAAAALGDGYDGHAGVDALRRQVAAFAYESITTVWLGLCR